ncbi:uncharacterized protein LOC143181734 isoform X1 [Calliopsis andreniformis]|uniref:uncharacterized protein LOC143181734 isoform X1 n=1 Tax=Calliopsis andreniformis TaxID=337506 RepID=UPI003FCD71C2
MENFNGSNKMATRKSSLSMEHRLQVLQDLNSGLSVNAIAAKYNVHSITVRRIRKSELSIRQFVNQGNRFKKSQRMRKGAYEDLEERLYAWFREKKARGEVITDMQLMQKTTELNRELPAASKFKGSKGWLYNFKKRYNICLMNVNRKSTSVNERIKNTQKKISNIREDSQKTEDESILPNLQEPVKNSGENIKDFSGTFDHLERQDLVEVVLVKEEPRVEEEEEEEEGEKEVEETQEQQWITGKEKCQEQGGATAQENQEEENEARARHAFSELEELSTKAPYHVQLMLKALKAYFLPENE